MTKRMITLLILMVGLPALWLLIAPDSLTWTSVVLLSLVPPLVYAVARWIGRAPSGSLVDMLNEIEGEPALPASASAPRREASAAPGSGPRTTGGGPQ
jgi:hypothetical protein